MQKPSRLKDFLSLSSEQKVQDVKLITKKYPNCIPVILLPTKDCNMDHLKSVKYIVNQNLSFAAFVMLIRQKCLIESHQAMFFFIKNKIPAQYILLSELYANEKDAHGYLEIHYCAESTFGGVA
jgi:hypothetical protein